MPEAIISHWGAELHANEEWLLQEPAITMLGQHLADTFAEIEKWDLRVKKASIHTHGENTYSITAVADRSDDIDPSPETGFEEASSAPRSVTMHFSCCPECQMPTVQGKIHPDNGCPYGIVDHVMST